MVSLETVGRELAGDLPPSAAETASAVPRGTQTLVRGLDVVQAVADGASSLPDVAAATGLHRSTAHRLIHGLLTAGVLHETSRGRYRLGSRLIGWGHEASLQNPLVDVARPILRGLSRVVHDTVHLGIEDADAVMYLDKIDGERGAQMRSRIGGRMPLSRTGIGKALLLDAPERWSERFTADTPAATPPRASEIEAFRARMAAAAEQGATLDMEENEPGIRCVAAPVRDHAGRIVAAISVSATTPYMPPERMRELVPLVRQAADEISTGIGGPSASRIALTRERAETDH
ncbi:MAG: IclR family transcriptional regulator [Brachybacterium sp.]|nr:IclR family transcriptional regulator [Brachybacterium sp.]